MIVRAKVNHEKVRRIIRRRRNLLGSNAPDDCNDFFANCCECCGCVDGSCTYFGASGIYTARWDGTMTLWFNDFVHVFNDNQGTWQVTWGGMTYTLEGTNPAGLTFAVHANTSYAYTVTGLINDNYVISADRLFDANGIMHDRNGNVVGVPYVNANDICPVLTHGAMVGTFLCGLHSSSSSSSPAPAPTTTCYYEFTTQSSISQVSTNDYTYNTGIVYDDLGGNIDGVAMLESSTQNLTLLTGSSGLSLTGAIDDLAVMLPVGEHVSSTSDHVGLTRQATIPINAIIVAANTGNYTYPMTITDGTHSASIGYGIPLQDANLILIEAGFTVRDMSDIDLQTLRAAGICDSGTNLTWVWTLVPSLYGQITVYHNSVVLQSNWSPVSQGSASCLSASPGVLNQWMATTNGASTYHMYIAGNGSCQLDEDCSTWPAAPNPPPSTSYPEPDTTLACYYEFTCDYSFTLSAWRSVTHGTAQCFGSDAPQTNNWTQLHTIPDGVRYHIWLTYNSPCGLDSATAAKITAYNTNPSLNSDGRSGPTLDL